MWIVDTALKARADQNRPIRVGIIGAGFMCQGLTNQISHSTPGMRVAAISNRRVRKGCRRIPLLWLRRRCCSWFPVAARQRVERSKPVVTDDAMLIARSDLIDVLVDVTGSVEFGARVALEAFRHGKDVVLMNAELDATIGPILQTYADRHGVIFTACEGDEPGIQMNLYRWVKGLGLTPRLLGNVKGLQDRYRNPTTQKGFAERWGQNPTMVTSFADGSKVSFEQAVVANATGFKVLSRGMSRGLDYHGDVLKIGEIYDLEELRRLGGAVDYVVGTPLTKVYCLAEHPDPKQAHYFNLYKMGPGPLYSFFVPYHLCNLEVPTAIARDMPVPRPGFEISGGPGGGGVCRRQARSQGRRGARRLRHVHDLRRGRQRRGDERGRYLPQGLVEGCKLLRDIAKDAVITYDDVVLPAGRLADRLRGEQYRRFRGETWLQDLLDSPGTRGRRWYERPREVLT